MNITKDVVADLWPLYVEGTATADSRALVEEYLREHKEWAEKLRAASSFTPLPAVPMVVPDKEVQMLNQFKKRVRWLRILWLVAISFTFQAFGRIVADTSWDVSPRNFIVMCIIAAVFWGWWLFASWRVRRLVP